MYSSNDLTSSRDASSVKPLFQLILAHLVNRLLMPQLHLRQPRRSSGLLANGRHAASIRICGLPLSWILSGSMASSRRLDMSANDSRRFFL